MNLEIIQKGPKFFIQDVESGEIQGKKGGYASRAEAQTALKSLSSASTLAKAPMPAMKTPMPAEMGAEMAPGGMPGMPTPGAPSPAALANLLKSKRSL